MTSLRLEANEMRAGVSRSSTSAVSPTENPEPLMVTRPRPTARSGTTEVTADDTPSVYRLRFQFWEWGVWSWLLTVIQLHIPVQVVPPALRRDSESHGDA